MEISFKGIDICDNTDIRREFSTIQCPIDLIIGNQDECVPASCFGKIKALNSKVNIHEIPNAQHLSFWTHPKEFNKILNNIL